MVISNSKCSIGIVTYNSEAIIDNCLKNIASNCATEIEVSIFDNNSSDSTKEKIKADFPKVNLIESSNNQGFAYGVNRLVENSSSEYILIMNPDVTINKNTLDCLIETLDTNPDCVVSAPITLDLKGNPENNARRFPSITTQFFESIFGGELARKLNKSEQLKGPKGDTKYFETEWIKGAIWMIRKQLFLEIGKMREDFFLYSEETEFALRAYLKGYKFLLNSNSEAQHVGGDSDINPLLYTLLSLNKIHMFKIHSKNLQAQVIRLLLLIGSTLRFFKPTSKKLRKSIIKSFSNFEKERLSVITELGGKIN